MNLPNTLSLGRIAAAPLVAFLPFVHSWPLRLLAFVLFVVTAVTDYYDGKLARSRNLVTRLGTLLDPLADKLLLVATFVPMFVLVGSGAAMGPLSPHTTPLIPGTLGVMLREGGVAGGEAFPFVTPFGLVGLPWWVLAIVLGRELFMTISRQIAARRGVVIGAMDLAKWKTGFQWTWVGSTFFWFFAATLASDERWRGAAWTSFAWFNAFVGLTTMTVAVLLTLYTLWLYVRRYGSLLVGGAVTGRAK